MHMQLNVYRRELARAASSWATQRIYLPRSRDLYLEHPRFVSLNTPPSNIPSRDPSKRDTFNRSIGIERLDRYVSYSSIAG